MRRQPTGGSNPGVLQEESRGTCIGKSNLSFYLRCPVFTSEFMRIFTDIWSTLGCDPGSRFPISLCENDHNQDGSTPIVKVIQSDTTRSFHVTSRYHLQTMGFPKTPPEGKKSCPVSRKTAQNAMACRIPVTPSHTLPSQTSPWFHFTCAPTGLWELGLGLGIHPSICRIWRFPEMGIPLVITHFNRNLHGFSVINQPFWGYPHLWKPPNIPHMGPQNE